MKLEIMTSDLSQKHQLVVWLFAVTAAVPFIGMSFPYGFPLFAILVVASLSARFAFFDRRELDTSFFLVMLAIPLAFFLGGLLLQLGYDSHYKSLLIDAASYTLAMFLLSSILSLRGIREAFMRAFGFMLIVSGSIIAAIGLYKFYMLLNGIFLDFLFKEGRAYPAGSSLVRDYNFFSLGLFLPIILCLQARRKTSSWVVRSLLFFSTAVIGLCIGLSSSRRGLFFLFIVIVWNIVAAIHERKTAAGRSEARRRRHRILEFAVLAFAVLGLATASTKSNLSMTIFNEDSFRTLEKIFERLSSLGDMFEGSAGSFGPRLARWKFAATLLEERPLFGILFGEGFGYQKLFGLQPFSDMATEYGYPHNLLLSVLLSNGIIGMAYYTFLFLFLFTIAFRREMSHYALYFAMYLVYIMTSGDQFFGHSGLAVIIFIIWFNKDTEASASKLMPSISMSLNSALR